MFNDLAHEIQQKLHESAVFLAKEKIPYSEMVCNQAVARVYSGSDLEYYSGDNTKTFPSHENAKHFKALTTEQLKAGLLTGDIALWYEKGGAHHMMIYDKNAGKDFDSWSTHS